MPKKRDKWEKTFDACAGSLAWSAEKLDPIIPGGMNYVKINVILFCICLPIVLVGLGGLLAFLLLA